ncbi:MAG: hypothetical protein GC156_02335 [Actinomycetales bacterium]|nr:hypothetical protein [Actinomycetales bacterium]
MSRLSPWVRGIVLTAFVGTTAAAMAACTPPLPPDVLAARAENSITCQVGDQPVAVPEDFAGLMLGVSSNLQGVCPEQTISEAAPGDPAKVQIVDHAPTAEDVATFQQNCPTAPIIVPVFAYPVSLAYSIIGLEGMVFPPEVVAGILNGTITSWEDPAIVAANPGVDLTGLPDITVLGLEQPSGSVEAMTTWLAKAAPNDWTSGPSSTLANATTTFPTSMDLLSELTLSDGPVAVLPTFLAVNNAVPIGSLPVKDTFIDPTDTGLAKVGAGAMTLTTDASGNITATPAVGGVPVPENFDLAASKVVLAEGQDLVGWPVEGIAHMMVCNDPKDPLPLSTAQYLVRLAGQGGLETFGVIPLPEPVRKQTFTPLKVLESFDPNAPLPSDSTLPGTGAGTGVDSGAASPAPEAS